MMFIVGETFMFCGAFLAVSQHTRIWCVILGVFLVGIGGILVGHS